MATIALRPGRLVMHQRGGNPVGVQRVLKDISAELQSLKDRLEEHVKQIAESEKADESDSDADKTDETDTNEPGDTV